LIDHYDWPHGREAMFRFGPHSGPVIIVALPLFEEANRTRAFAVTLLRTLAGHGIAGALPDFPGQGESLAPTDTVSIERLRMAYGAAAMHLGHDHHSLFGISIRSGALIDECARLEGRWQLAPQDGESLLHNLKRIKQAEIGELPSANWRQGDIPLRIAGNLILPELLNELEGCTLHPCHSGQLPLRIARHLSDPAPADVKFAGAPLWRRAEPDNDPILARACAADIAAWMGSCAA
jgi:hypothetical protein